MKTRVANLLVFHTQGSAFVKFIIILGGLGVLVFAGFQIVPIVSLQREHQTFEGAVDTRIQSLSSVSLPDTQKALTEEISQMLDKMKAQYKPHYIHVNAEERVQKLSVQVWYSKPHSSLFIANPKQFYVHVEKIGIPVHIQTPTPAPLPSKPIQPPVQIAKPPPTVLPKRPRPTPTIEVIRVAPATNATDATFAREVLQSPTPVMVNFWASWCGYCRKAMPAVDEASRRFAGRMKIVKLNVDKNKTTAAQYGVSGIPAFIFFKDGKIIGKKSGFSSKQRLFALIQQYL